MAARLGRREFLKAAGAAGALFLARPGISLGSGRAIGVGAARASALLPGSGLFVVHSDLHNHSLISGDAFGDPQDAYRQMAARGIDVACLTEHAISGKHHGELTCPGHEQGGCHTVEGINETDWAYMRTLADDADAAIDDFVTFRGFEWSTPTVGHINVWFSEQYTDALHEHAFFTPAAAAEIDRIAPVPSEIVDNFEQAPDIATMRFFYEWLSSPPDRDIFGGGNDGIGCFNHPNEFGTFESFVYHPDAAERIVSIEALNGDRDFMWWDRHKGKPNPINACLNAGWRVGFTGVSDEHSTEYGRAGMARGGLWVAGLTRETIRESLVARRSFATFEPGLRLDALANGVPMGGLLQHEEGPVEITLDIDGGEALAGKPLILEVIRPGNDDVSLAAEHQVTQADAPFVFSLDVDRAQGDWVFLRITDPSGAPDANATEPFASHGRALAYASPWFLV